MSLKDQYKSAQISVKMQFLGNKKSLCPGLQFLGTALQFNYQVFL